MAISGANPSEPPKWADRMIEILVKDKFQEEVIGDLHQFHLEMQEKQERGRYLKYCYHVLQFLRPYALKSIPKNSILYTMIKMNFLIAYRNMLRDKFFSSLNIVGLALGLTVTLMIGIYVADELSYDKHWTNSEQIFRVIGDLKFENNEYSLSTTPAPMARAYKQDFPEIVKAGRFRNEGSEMVQIGDRYFKEPSIAFADQEVLEIFQLNILSGTDKISEPGDVLLSLSSAQRLFGKSDPIDQTLTYNDRSFQVRGVYQDIPENSHFRFSSIYSMESYPDSKNLIWLSNNYRTYLLLDSSTDWRSLDSKLSSVNEKYFGPQLQQLAGVSWDQFMESGSYINYSLQPLQDIHLTSNLGYEINQSGNIQYVMILIAAGIFVLVIAAINFMNISTARSSVRAKEVGMRKVLGSRKSLLITQFLTESILNALIAMVVAIGLMFLLLSPFNELTDKQIINPLVGRLGLFPYLFATSVALGVLAGLYPAFFLSQFSPLKVLKGDLRLGLRSGFMRNLLVVIQFTASVVLIFGAIIIYAQLQFTQNTSLGFNKDQVLIIEETGVLGDQVASFRNEIAKLDNVIGATRAASLPTNENRSDSPILPKSATTVEGAVGSQLWLVDEYYIPTLQMELLAGRNFDSNIASDSAGVILNEAAVKRLGFENPIGEELKTIGDFSIYGMTEFKVIGVVKDFHFEHLKENIAPLGLFFGNSNNRISVRFKAENAVTTIEEISQIWEDFNAPSALTYNFMDEQFSNRYASEAKLGILFNAFAILSIIIAMIGLFGLAAFTSEIRKKEIGIRKVLGASIRQLITSQLKGYMVLLGIAFILGLPLAHWLMLQWLDDFAYRTDISVIHYIIPMLSIFLLASLTVSSIAFKASNRNPVDNLHIE
jgi:putative ABC transport system permease protein